MGVIRVAVIHAEPLRVTPYVKNLSGSVHASSMQRGECVTSVRPTRLASRSRIQTGVCCATAIPVGPRVGVETCHVTRIRDSARASRTGSEEDVTAVLPVMEKSFL